MKTTKTTSMKNLRIDFMDDSLTEFQSTYYKWTVSDHYIVVSTLNEKSNRIYPLCNIRCMTEESQ
jgi:hypothetical protein